MRADENSDSAFLLVLGTFMSCVALPWSIGLIISLFCSGLKDKDGKIRRAFLISLLLNILMWLLIYFITSSISGEDWLQGFDPYATLGVDRSDSITVIKRAYRQLSVKYHPDKIKNPTPETEKMFFLINQAKDILTDPVKHDNFLKYGNPDGRTGGFKMSIALPTFLFSKNNQLVVLLIFAFFIIVVFPCCVYKWYSSGDHNVDPETGVVMDNIQIYLKETTKKMRNEQIVPMLANSYEYIEFLKSATKEEVVELNILLNQLPKAIKEKQKGSLFLKNIVLIYAHMMNLQIADKVLKKNYEKIRKTVPRQIEFLVNQILQLIQLYHMNQFNVLVPLSNVLILLDFQKRYLHRIYTANGLETFTEEIDFDTIELLQSKGESLVSLEKNRKRTFEKLGINEGVQQKINQYYEGIPDFSFGIVKGYVEGHDSIEEGDNVTIDIEIKLNNHENLAVIDNMLRESFNYPGQETRILKLPYLFVLLSEKNGKLISFKRVPCKAFLNQDDRKKVREQIIVRMNATFGIGGDKKLNVKLFNDTYLTSKEELNHIFTSNVYFYNPYSQSR
jgi:hypothetical protein